MNSVWSNTVTLPKFPALKTDIHTEVLIIGGGLAGILCAYMLQQAGVDYVLAEADNICGGITKNTTAKITAQHGLIYDTLIRRFGVNHARLYWEANAAALLKYDELCKKIDCDFEIKDNFVYSLNDKEKIKREIKALRQLDLSPITGEELPLPFPIAAAVGLRNQAQFHPLRFVAELGRELRIYEHSPIREIRKHTAFGHYGKITANKIIVTTHFPFINKHGGYFLKLYQHRSYVIALENSMAVDGMYVDEAPTGLSLRNCGDLLLLGGGGHRTGKPGGNWEELRSFARRYFPASREKYHWAAQDCMTLDGMPYIGSYGKHTPYLYVATGFHKWGMTSSMVAASLLTDLVLGRENAYTAIFSPARRSLRPQLAVNAAEALGSFLTLSNKRCPHLGCALKWNAQEHSWDCPCHGSRFDTEGSLLDNPATGHLKK